MCLPIAEIPNNMGTVASLPLLKTTIQVQMKVEHRSAPHCCMTTPPTHFTIIAVVTEQMVIHKYETIHKLMIYGHPFNISLKCVVQIKILIFCFY